MTVFRRLVCWFITGLLVGSGLQLSVKHIAAQDGPLTNFSNLAVRTDGNGYLRIVFSASGYSGQDGPLTNSANLRMRTDGSGYLIVALSGNVVFEGATADDFETTLAIADPTADRTFTLPDATSGTLMYSTLATNGVDAANSIWGESNDIVFEGATADASETRLQPTNVTGDIVLTMPGLGNVNGALIGSTLTTNDVGVVNSIWGISNSLVFEGATADDFETSITPANPTADRTLTLPDLGNGTFLLTAVANSGTVGFARQSVTIDAVTTFAATETSVLLECTGAENILTITGGLAGMRLYIEHTDTECTIADDDDPTAANAIDLTGTSANDIGAVAKMIVLYYNGTIWFQVAESDN